MATIRACRFCKKELAEDNRKNYCDKSCQNRAAKARARERKGRPDRRCANCVKPLPEGAHGRILYCSEDCRREAVQQRRREREKMRDDIDRTYSPLSHRQKQAYDVTKDIRIVSTGRPPAKDFDEAMARAFAAHPEFEEAWGEALQEIASRESGPAGLKSGPQIRKVGYAPKRW